MDVEGIQKEPGENSNWRLNGIHYDSCDDDWLGDGPVKHDMRPHTIFPSWACSRKTEPSWAACSSTTRPSFDFVQLPNHLDASPWIISHISGSTCIRLPVGHAQELGVGVCLLLLKHRRINTPNFSREITGLLRSLVIAVLSVISFCLGGKHLFIA